MKSRINSLYTSAGVVKQARDKFKSANPKTLFFENFLSNEFYSSLYDLLKKLDGKKIYNPEKESFSLLEVPVEFDNFLKSEFFLSFLENIFGKKITELNYSLKSFEHKDFRLINEDVNERVDFFILFCEVGWKQEFGGYTAYTKGDGEPLIFDVFENSMGIIGVEKDMFDFVKYVKNFAGNRKIFKLEGSFR